ncbi:hypothetical protein SETIT_2G050400v2 [Setaria italica]|uniref:NB-ARC domain-containing protein n=1 Tax=Setaria italica TaxID=4555 RepID=K3ZQF8_SETIT|nr:disease resistance protein RPP13 [Setaria italica]RCV09698.1 hypothetical protein SETIT_2G050400v2 [Setaria italica]
METAAQSLVGNVGQLLSEEYRLLSSVGGEVTELRDDLATMNALLRMQSEADEAAVDHFVREWMKQLRELAYDAEDSVSLYKLRVKCRHGDNMWFKLMHLVRTLIQRRRLAGEISAIRTRAITISERHARFGVNRDALRRSASFAPAVGVRTTPALPASNGQDHSRQFVDIGDQARTLAERLKEDEDSFKVFSVVGFGGVGKTTLTVEVCRQLQAEFPYQAMVPVSQAFEATRDLEKLLNSILQQVVKPQTDRVKEVLEEATVKIDDLGLYLSDKRYLIVIDDVWTIHAWEAIQFKLVEVPNNCGGRIIVTTRIETVADACSSASVTGHYTYHMKALEFEDAKKLFLVKTFGKMDADYPKELKVVMGNILKKCGGMPLAIVSVANILAGYRSTGSKEKWETVCKLIGSSQMESNPTLEGMRHIVALSYNHLPHELKECMMYLSIFPEDYEVNKKRLLSRWIAEGLIPEKRGWTLMEVAESCLNELLRRNMVVPRIGRGGDVKSCQVHDVLLEVMVSKSLESNFVSLLGGQYTGMSYDRIRRLSIQGDDRKPGEQQGPTDSEPKKKKMGRRNSRHALQGMDVVHVRSLSMFQVGAGNSNKLLDHLDKFTLLRVLDLEDCEGLTNDHMKYICRLYLLKFLSLKGTGISQVPPQVDKIEHLQTFDVQDTRLKGLPKSVTNLEKLERLQFSSKHGWDVMWRLPQGLSKMKGLRELDHAILENDIEVAKEIGKLEQLQYLTIYIDSYSIDNAEVLECFAKSLSDLHSLRSLHIGALGWTSIMQFLHELPTPPRLLRYLGMQGEIGGRLPHWIGSLTYLIEICICWARLDGDEPFGVLCKLPNLKSISLNAKYYTGEKLIASTGHNFPALVDLCMSPYWSDDPFPKVFKIEAGAMPKLETLKFDFETYEKSIVGIDHLTNLREVEVTTDKSNSSASRALEQLKAERASRPESKQFQIAVKYH